MTNSNFSDLVGKTLIEIQNKNDELIFICDDGKKYRMCYYEDCCASCTIDEINGDLQDLIGNPILQAEEKTNLDLPPREDCDYSYTWTFYDLATIKGFVQIKWFGTSNGYYSETATFEEIKTRKKTY